MVLECFPVEACEVEFFFNLTRIDMFKYRILALIIAAVRSCFVMALQFTPSEAEWSKWGEAFRERYTFSVGAHWLRIET